jgi:hypothetical protein
MEPDVHLGIVTVSDRASREFYDDCSDPAIQAWLTHALVTPWEAVARLIPVHGLYFEAHQDMVQAYRPPHAPRQRVGRGVQKLRRGATGYRLWIIANQARRVEHHQQRDRVWKALSMLARYICSHGISLGRRA